MEEATTGSHPHGHQGMFYGSRSPFMDTAFGYFLRKINKSFLHHPEEDPDFVCPSCYSKEPESDSSSIKSEKDDDLRDVSRNASRQPTRPDLSTRPTEPVGGNNNNLGVGAVATRTTSHRSLYAQRTNSNRFDPSKLEKQESRPIVPQKTEDGITLVDWYSTDDPENPQNWTTAKKGFVTFIICLYTFAVYMGSSIFTGSYGPLIAKWHISQQVMSFALSLYVLAYGMGPLIFSPLSEIPKYGRNALYNITFFIFVIMCIPTALVNNLAGLLVCRFLQGFFGSPALATGGASLQDIWPFIKMPYFLSLWVGFATMGPSLGPLISGFSVPAENWRWSVWEMLWLAGPTFGLMFFFLPETSASNILLRRAERLRAITGNMKMKSQSEIDQEHLNARDIVIESLWRPLQLTTVDFAVLYANLYSALIYSIYYSFFEVFPLVYQGIYGFNLGELGLVYTCIIVSTCLALLAYWSFWGKIVVPQIKAGVESPPESILIPGIFCSFFVPVGLFVFGWTSRHDIHWIVSIIGIVIYSWGVFIIFQVIFMYLPMIYPQYAASLFATNDFWRSALASGGIHYAQPLFHNLGIGRGCSLLGGLSCMGIIGILILYFFGAKLRERSKFAVKGSPNAAPSAGQS